MKETKSERNVSLDLLKLVMSLMVVGIHSNFLADIHPLFNFLTVHGVFRLAVPVFLVINGFYFYSAVSNQRALIWLKRVGSLYIFWMAVYSYFWVSFTVPSIFRLIETLVIGYHHLWYVSGMLGAAIILLLVKRLELPFLIAGIFVLFATGVFIQYSGNYHVFNGVLDKITNVHWIHRNALLFSFPFFAIGYLISKHNLHKLVPVSVAGGMVVLGLFLLLVESYTNYSNPKNDGGFDNYASLLIGAPAVFLLFSNLNVQGNSKNIALYSSAIFFTHSLALSFAQRFTDLSQTPLTFLVIALSIGISYFVIRLNKKFSFIL